MAGREQTKMSDSGARAPIRTLDPFYYFDTDVYRQERERIFYKTWQFICHISEVPEAGCFLFVQ